MGNVDVVRLVMPGSPITANLAATYFQGSQALKGRLVRVNAFYGDTTTTGSIWAYESGTNVEVFRINGFSADVNAYPRATAVSTTNGTLYSGGNIYEHPIVNGPIFLAGSGLGTTKLISGVDLYIERG